MSRTFTIQGNASILRAYYYPAIDLESQDEYSLGLIGFHTYNTIPNIEPGCDKFLYIDEKKKLQSITIPAGSYEISDIETYLNKRLGEGRPEEDNLLSLKPNNNTLKCEIKSKYDIDFSQNDTIGKLLGFSGKEGVLKANKLYESDLPVQITKVVSIRIECNITTGSYYDNNISHTIYEFSPLVDPGYSINIEPKNVIYLPINTNRISEISLKIFDQDGSLVNFRGEKILVRLELRKNGN